MLQSQSTPGSPRRQSRYTRPSARSNAERLPGSRQEGQGFRLRGLCHGDVPDSASLQLRDSTVPEGGLWVKCWANSPRRQVITALEEATGWTIWDVWKDFRLGLIPPRAPPGGPNQSFPSPQTDRVRRSGAAWTCCPSPAGRGNGTPSPSLLTRAIRPESGWTPAIYGARASRCRRPSGGFPPRPTTKAEALTPASATW